MADRCRPPDGWTIEVVHLAEGERLRIRHHGFYVADAPGVTTLRGGFRRPSWCAWSATR
jgi:hypothetical protein